VPASHQFGDGGNERPAREYVGGKAPRELPGGPPISPPEQALPEGPCSEFPSSEKFSAYLDSRFLVHVQEAHGSAADRGEAHNPGTLHRKMLIPRVRAGIEERNHLSGDGIDAGKVRPFERVAVGACQCEIRGIIAAPRAVWLVRVLSGMRRTERPFVAAGNTHTERAPDVGRTRERRLPLCRLCRKLSIQERAGLGLKSRDKMESFAVLVVLSPLFLR
jgi:hypothetical protein